MKYSIVQLVSVVLLSSVLLTSKLVAQNWKSLDVDFIINEAAGPVSYPELGNLVAPQFSETDFNGDGIMDLFIFDRNGNVPIPLIREENGDYIFSKEMMDQFPQNLHSWVLIRDYNGDGIGDIFTAPQTPGIPGIEVWTGSSINGVLSFELLEFNINGLNALQYLSGTNWIIVYVAFTDVPGIEDIDGDGDLDILTFDPAGSLATLFKNFSVEEGYGKDTIIMDIGEQCWGKFREDEFSSTITLSESSSSCAPAFRSSGILRHSGSTISFPDINRDGTYDLLLGDLTAGGVNFLNNNGSNISAWMTSVDLTFPSYNVPIQVSPFISTFLIDINRDGFKDLIAAPNNRLHPPSSENVWLYLDQGTDTARYELMSKDFLINQSVLLGNNTDPAVIDIDIDGDLDLLIGSSGLLGDAGQTQSTIFLFENTSTEDKLRFTLKDDNFLNIQSLNTQSGRYAPAIGDLDGDGDEDIIIGDANGKLIFYQNIAGPEEVPLFADFVYNYADVSVGQNAKPQILDVDGDGLQDIVVGERNDNKQGEILGGLNFFKNNGSLGSPVFDPSTDTDGNTAALAGIFTRDPGYSVGSSSPALVFSGEELIGVVGSESGTVKLYEAVNENIYSITSQIENNVLPFRLGNNSTPVPVDLNGNDFIDFIIGSSRGSISFFESDITFSGSTSTHQLADRVTINIFPNPTNGVVQVESDAKILSITVHNLGGQKILKTKSSSFLIEVPGLYIVRVHTSNGSDIQKIIVVN